MDSTIDKPINLQHAANCALWLLSQPELKSIIDGEWGDPIAIKNFLEESGCVPSCQPLKIKNNRVKEIENG